MTAADLFPGPAEPRAAEALRTAGVPVELHLVPGADHMWLPAPDPHTVFDAAAVDFARRVLCT